MANLKRIQQRIDLIPALLEEVVALKPLPSAITSGTPTWIRLLISRHRNLQRTPHHLESPDTWNRCTRSRKHRLQPPPLQQTLEKLTTRHQLQSWTHAQTLECPLRPPHHLPRSQGKRTSRSPRSNNPTRQRLDPNAPNHRKRNKTTYTRPQLPRSPQSRNRSLNQRKPTHTSQQISLFHIWPSDHLWTHNNDTNPRIRGFNIERRNVEVPTHHQHDDL